MISKWGFLKSGILYCAVQEYQGAKDIAFGRRLELETPAIFCNRSAIFYLRAIPVARHSGAKGVKVKK